MNKTTRIAAVAVPLLLAYPAAAWLVGKRVEASLGEQYQLLADNPSAKIVARDYRGGIFSASETLTIELFPAMTQAIARQQQEIAAQNPGIQLPPVQPTLISVRSTIKHGPFAGFSKLAAAVVDSELVFDGDLQQALVSVFGSEKPLQVHTEYRFAGGGVSTISSPGFSTHWAAGQGLGRNTVVWDGFRMRIDFAPAMQRYTLTAEAPKLAFQDSQGGGMAIADLRFNASQQRIFDDEPLLYSGTQQLTLAEAKVSPSQEGGAPVVVKRVAYDIDVPASGEFIDIVAKLGAESLQVGAQEFGPAHYDLSLRHLHARTTATLWRAVTQLYAAPLQPVVAPGDAAKMFAPLAGPAAELLKHNPEFAIDRVSFRSPHGEAMLAARVKLKSASAADFANPAGLLAKLDAGAEVSLPEAFVGEVAKNAGSASDADAADGGTPQERLAGWIAQGLVQRDGALLKVKFALKDGAMTVNGQPFNPGMLQAAPGQPM